MLPTAPVPTAPLVRVLHADRGSEIVAAPGAVWVYDRHGHCLGRFGRAGFTIHHRLADAGRLGRDRIAGGQGPANAAAWHRFCALMLEHHTVVVPSAARPSMPWAKEDRSDG